MLEFLVADAIVSFARVVTGARALWQGCAPEAKQRIYIGNHCSHGDFVLSWSALPRRMRRQTRPVAGADYWQTSDLRRYIGERVFNAVPIPRGAGGVEAVERLRAALAGGASLIVFPEGTRNLGEEMLQPFRSGLYWLAKARPDVECVPVWLRNLNRVLPKGEIIPVPLLCTLTFGTPLHLESGEEKDAFVGRARDSLLALGKAAAARNA